MSANGQCLCGAVKYELANPPSVTGVCHCLNCQRQAGSAYSNPRRRPKIEFSLTAGEPKLYEDSDTRERQHGTTLFL